MKLIDLTAGISHGMARHPAPHLPPVEVVPVARHEDAKRSVHRMILGTHVSTHIDAPFHAIPGGKSVDQIPLETLCGQAALIRLSGFNLCKPIDAKDLRKFEKIFAKNKRMILETGWARDCWGTEKYFTEGPYLSRDAAVYLSGLGLVLIGIDFPNVDSDEDTRPGIPAPNHNILLKKGIVLVENLINLEKVTAEQFYLMALPLKLVGGDGCPCRVVAKID